MAGVDGLGPRSIDTCSYENLVLELGDPFAPVRMDSALVPPPHKVDRPDKHNRAAGTNTDEQPMTEPVKAAPRKPRKRTARLT